MAEAVLRIEDLRKNFGALAVTDGVTLDVAPGELHAEIGRASCRERVLMPV